MPRIRLRRYFVAGLLVWVPLGATILVLKISVDLMDKTLLLLPTHYRPEIWLGFRVPGLGVVLTLFLLLVTGSLAANFLGRRLLDFGESLVNRIPLVRWIYSGVKKVAETVLSSRSESFRKVLLIQYPREGIWSLCFQTASTLGEVQARTGEMLVCVFVPTTPNPTSGFIIMIPKSQVIELEMTVEEALRMIISLGVVVPEWKKHELVKNGH